MGSLKNLFNQHIVELNIRTAKILKRERLDFLVIHSGKLHKQFLDDMDYPFKVNPQFKAWVPLLNNPNCWLIIDGVAKPKLIFYRIVDFWHKVPDIPNGFWVDAFDIVLFDKPDLIVEHLPHNLNHTAYIGEHVDIAKILNIKQCNPDGVLSSFHYHRAYKTDYEMACLREANKIAIEGHHAAKLAFLEQQSEFDIHLAYLKATKQAERDVPYTNIVALNEHAAILHYTELDRELSKQSLSLLIDAGASFNGYAADITRTYSCTDDYFNKLVSA